MSTPPPNSATVPLQLGGRKRREGAEGKYGNSSQVTLRRALWRTYNEHWAKLVEAPRFEQRIEVLLQLMDPDLPICELTTAHVSDAMLKRAKVGFTKSD